MLLRRDWTRTAAAATAAAVVAWAAGGCTHAQPRTKEHASSALLDSGPQPKLNGRQAADVQYALGRSQEAEGHPAEAETAYLAALARDPKRADAQARLAILADQKGDAAGADKRFALALALAPNDPEILCDRGYNFYLHRRWAEAESALKRAIAARPDHARSHTNLALVLASQGDRDKALAEFARAGCDDADARSNLALVLAKEGHLPEAREEYARALAAKPASDPARQGLRVADKALARGSNLPALPRAYADSGKVAPKPDPALARTSATVPAR